MEARLAAPSYRGERGFPVYFARDALKEVLPTLRGDAGAREYIEAHAEDMVTLPTDDPGCIEDADRPEDLARLDERSAPCDTSG